MFVWVYHHNLRHWTVFKVWVSARTWILKGRSKAELFNMHCIGIGNHETLSEMRGRSFDGELHTNTHQQPLCITCNTTSWNELWTWNPYIRAPCFSTTFELQEFSCVFVPAEKTKAGRNVHFFKAWQNKVDRARLLHPALSFIIGCCSSVFLNDNDFALLKFPLIEASATSELL